MQSVLVTLGAVCLFKEGCLWNEPSHDEGLMSVPRRPRLDNPQLRLCDHMTRRQRMTGSSLSVSLTPDSGVSLTPDSDANIVATVCAFVVYTGVAEVQYECRRSIVD